MLNIYEMVLCDTNCNPNVTEVLNLTIINPSPKRLGPLAAGLTAVQLDHFIRSIERKRWHLFQVHLLQKYWNNKQELSYRKSRVSCPHIYRSNYQWPWNLGQSSLKIIENGTIWKLGMVSYLPSIVTIATVIKQKKLFSIGLPLGISIFRLLCRTLNELPKLHYLELTSPVLA